MGLQTLFDDQMDKLASADNPYFGDLPKTVTYTITEDGTGDYDFSTGDPDTGTSSTKQVKGLFGGFTRSQANTFDIAPGDRSFSFSVKSVSFTPQTHDTLDDGTTIYTVIEKTLAAFDALWVLQLRESA